MCTYIKVYRLYLYVPTYLSSVSLSSIICLPICLMFLSLRDKSDRVSVRKGLRVEVEGGLAGGAAGWRTGGSLETGSEPSLPDPLALPPCPSALTAQPC